MSATNLQSIRIRVELHDGLVPDKIKLYVSKNRRRNLLKSDRTLKAEKFEQLFGGILLKRTLDIKRRRFVYISITVAKKEQFAEYKVQFIRNDTILAEFVRSGHAAELRGK